MKPQIINNKQTNKQTNKPNKISPNTDLQKTYTNIKHKTFEELVPSVLPLFEVKFKSSDWLKTVLLMTNFMSEFHFNAIIRNYKYALLACFPSVLLLFITGI